jgi:YHS domain-containing protein
MKGAAMKKRALMSLMAAAVLVCAVMFAGTAWAKPQETCPIMGGAINKSVYTDYNGKRVYFCCKGCPETFLKEPDKYITQMESAGIELEKVPTKPQVSK